RNSDDDERARLVDQAVPLGCCLMAEDGIGTGAKQRRPERRLPGRLPGEAGIDAALESLPAATAHTATYRVRPDASPGGLTASHGTSLELQHINGPIRHVDWHGITVLDPLSNSQRTPNPVDNSACGGLSVDNRVRHRR